MVRPVNHVRWVNGVPSLKGSILVYAFEGWNDAGEAASTAIGTAVRAVGAEPIGEFDPEPFYDFTEARPDITLAAGHRIITWPTTAVSLYRGFDGDVVFIEGPEPHFRWREFAATVADIAEALNATMAISMGALISDVAHSRPTPVHISSAHDEVRSVWSIERPTYEGPTGIVGVVSSALLERDVGTASLWASVPSYVPHATSPKAALALLEQMERIADMHVDPDDLPEAAKAYESQIDSLVADDEETLAYVAELEQRHDESLRTDTGDVLIAELEQFLRDQD